MKRSMISILTCSLLLALSPRLEGASETPKKGGTLTLAIRKDLTVMNPLVRTFSTDQSIRDLIYEPLLALDEKGDIKPKLATSWKISPDGRVDLPLTSIGFVPRFFTHRDSVKGFTTDGDGSFVWSDGGLTHTWLDK